MNTSYILSERLCLYLSDTVSEGGKRKMFIKVKLTNGNEIMLNSDTIIRIAAFVKSRPETQEPLHGCYVELVSGTVIEVGQPFNQLECMLQPNSIEKEIERLKLENMQIRTRTQYDEVHNSIYGGKYSEQR